MQITMGKSDQRVSQVKDKCQTCLSKSAFGSLEDIKFHAKRFRIGIDIRVKLVVE